MEIHSFLGLEQFYHFPIDVFESGVAINHFANKKFLRTSQLLQ